MNHGFSARYNTDNLVYYELFDRLDDAIHREEQLKKYHRDWKEQLINNFNPIWKDLAEDIGVNADYIKAVKDAYETGQYLMISGGNFYLKTPGFDSFYSLPVGLRWNGTIIALRIPYNVEKFNYVNYLE